MNIELVTGVLETPDPTSIAALLDAEDTVFWIDWREQDEDIPSICESLLRTGTLTCDYKSGAPREVDSLLICFGERQVQLELLGAIEDRHRTLCALNEALAPDFEVRFCIDSNGADTLAFVPLSCETWRDLEQKFGAQVSRRFYRLFLRPNVFTDPLPF